MVEIISGVKGTGKTKRMIDRANTDVTKLDGSIVYVDKNNDRMLEVDSKIRMIDLSAYPVNTTDGFIGFLCGMLSQNSDIQEVFLDSFLKIGHIESADELTRVIEILDTTSQKFDLDFVLSVSHDAEDLPDVVKTRLV